VQVCRGTFPTVKQGYVTLSDRPGLGIEVDWAQMDRLYPYQGQSLRPPGGR